MDYKDLDQSVAEWRMCRLNRQLPKRYQDIAPKPLALIPPPSLQSECPEADSGISHSPAPQSSMQLHAPPIRRILKSVCNAFGLH